MADLAPWLALAGVGALHGLNPAAGWLLAAGCGLRSGGPARALRALLPIAAGHAVSVLLVAALVAASPAIERAMLQGVAGGLLLLAIVLRRLAAGLAIWSFMMSTLHGAGMMLVPALAPLCLGDNPAREITASGSLARALAAVAVHAAAMLGVAGLVAAGAATLVPHLIARARSGLVLLTIAGDRATGWCRSSPHPRRRQP